MEQAIKQALQRAVTAHKEGRIQDAERLYRSILRSRPFDPDVNHNLGQIAVSQNDPEAALPLFRKALEGNPNIERLWLSYISTLIRAERYVEAAGVIEQAKQNNVAESDVKALEKTLEVRARESEFKLSEKKALLFEHYREGRFDEAGQIALLITSEFPTDHLAWKVLGAILGRSGRYTEAVDALQKSVDLSPKDAEAYNNLGSALRELGKLKVAEANLKQAVALDSDYPEAYSNLGNTYMDLGELDEAEANFKQAIKLKPDFAAAHNNLGVVSKELKKLREAEESFTRAIALAPDFASAHINYGSLLLGMERLEEAEKSFREAIALEPSVAKTHISLGCTLKELGCLQEAEASFETAIALDPDSALAYSSLGITMYARDCTDLALETLEKAVEIDPELKDAELVLNVIRARKQRERDDVLGNVATNSDMPFGLSEIPLILMRDVEPSLIARLYEMENKKLSYTQDARFGNGVCSKDFNTLNDDSPIMQDFARDLREIMMDAVQAEIFVYDSFFNILAAEGGSTPHSHLMMLDQDRALGIKRQKYSLVYYLDVGDQDCSEPGALLLHDPEEHILPTKGMIVIIPAARKHSAVYNGKSDRVMLGVNFYSL